MEFGSDFHALDYPLGDKGLIKFYPESNLYASGRHALLALIIARDWKRLWVPSYFCEETLEYIKQAGVKLCKYKLTPIDNPNKIFSKIPVEKGDGMLIVNYFGLFDKPILSDIGCEIIEDHTHNLISGWARESTADWCFASIRKTLPITDGGILWSPNNLPLPTKAHSDERVSAIIKKRHYAMEMKSRYLSGFIKEKKTFFQLLKDTEECFGTFPISNISLHAKETVEELDISEWYRLKRENWKMLKRRVSLPSQVTLLENNNMEDTMFSFILIFEDFNKRNIVKQELIKRAVYPAILWNINSNFDIEAKNFGDRMLSIHCDGRYSEKDILLLADLINDSLQ